MRSSTLVLAISLSANLFLMGVLLREHSSRERVLTPVDADAPGERPFSNRSGGSDQAGPAIFAAGQSVTSAPLWARLYSDDLQKVVDGLRAAGFPRVEIAAIVSTLLNDRSIARRHVLMGPREVPAYWQSPVPTARNTELERELQRRMEPDQKVFRSLFLSDEFVLDDPQTRAHFIRRVGELSDEKLRHLIQINKDYAELRQQVAASAAQQGPAAWEEHQMLEQEYQRDVQAVLTPEEYEQFRLRSGPTADSLRSRLDPFQPTEQEFKTLHALHEAVGSGVLQYGGTEEMVRARQQATEALNPQIEAVLGPERYADYQQTLQEGSQRVNNLLMRLDLPLRTGGQIEEMRKDLTQRAEAVRTDASLTPGERAVRLGAIEQEARQRVGATLGGERNVAAYEDIKGWIRDLRPKTAL